MHDMKRGLIEIATALLIAESAGFLLMSAMIWRSFKGSSALFAICAAIFAVAACCTNTRGILLWRF